MPVGPDPRRALELLDEMGLYSTTFADTTKKIEFEPDQSLWRPSYVFVSDLLAGKYPSNLEGTLIIDGTHKYIAWVLSNFTPWIDAPIPQPLKSGGKTPLHMAVNAAREGIKADNKVSDILSASLQHVDEITNLKNGFIAGRDQQQKQYAAGQDPSARDTLGMAIRKWGSTWRSQATFALILEVARSPAENHRSSSCHRRLI
jgi:tRNA nucleotidyltransferase (CCA-adding enzyme)